MFYINYLRFHLKLTTTSLLVFKFNIYHFNSISFYHTVLLIYTDGNVKFNLQNVHDYNKNIDSHAEHWFISYKQYYTGQETVFFVFRLQFILALIIANVNTEAEETEEKLFALFR